MIKGASLPLRARLEWLVKAAQDRRYGNFLNTANTALATDYVVATGQAWKKESGGRIRARLLSDDLRELVDRGILTRFRAKEGFLYALATAAPSGLPAVSAIETHGRHDPKPRIFSDLPRHIGSACRSVDRFDKSRESSRRTAS